MPRLMACLIHHVAYVENLKPFPVELVHGMDQAEVALLDQVEEGQLRGLVPLGE